MNYSYALQLLPDESLCRHCTALWVEALAILLILSIAGCLDEAIESSHCLIGMRHGLQLVGISATDKKSKRAGNTTRNSVNLIKFPGCRS